MDEAADVYARVNAHRGELGLEPLVAVGEYHEWEHPRGHDGKWILKGGFIRALIGQHWQQGRVAKMNPNGTVTVKTQRGTVDLPPDHIEASKAKAIIGEDPSHPSYGVARAPEITQRPNPVSKGALRPSTEEERIANKMPNTKIVESWFNPDPEGGLVGLTRQEGIKKPRYSYRQIHHTYQAAIKYHRLQAMHASMPELLAAVRKDASHDDTAAAVAVMAATGMRPGSTTKAGKATAYGATTLRAKHARIVPGQGDEKPYAVLTFIGKGGKPLEIATEDPTVVSAIQTRLDGANSPEDRLFKTTSDKASAYLRAHTQAHPNAAVVGDLMTKDLRTYVANRIAMMAMQMPQFQEMPKTRDEFEAMRMDLAAFVSEKLGNTVPVALRSYINPMIFEKWAEGLEDSIASEVLGELMQQQGEE